MTTLSVSNAQQLTAALNTAKGGDTIALASGSYGDVYVTGLTFSPAVTITAADPAQPPVLRTLVLTNASGIVVDGLKLFMTPTASTPAWQPVVAARSCRNISIRGCGISAGPAMNGIDPSATAANSTLNVLGFATGLGVQAIDTVGFEVTECEIHDVGKGFGLSGSRMLIAGNDIRRMRQSGVSSGGLNDVLIIGNVFAESHPWAWNQPYGDHGDFIHIWTDPDVGTSRNIRIIGNIIDQGAGTATLGINFESHGGYGFESCMIAENAMILGNAQGLRLQAFAQGEIANNVCLAPAGAAAAPALVFAGDGCTGNHVHDNIWPNQTNQGPDGGNLYAWNRIAQNLVPGGPSYYDPALVAEARALANPAQIRALIQGALPVAGPTTMIKAADLPQALPSLDPALSMVVLSDNGLVLLPAALAASPLLGKLANADGTPPKVNVQDTAAAISAAFNAICAMPHFWHLQFTDRAPLYVTAAQFVQGAATLRAISGQSGGIIVQDTAANISAHLSDLLSVQTGASPHFSQVIVADGAPLVITAAQKAIANPILTRLVTAAGAKAEVTVS